MTRDNVNVKFWIGLAIAPLALMTVYFMYVYKLVGAGHVIMAIVVVATYFTIAIMRVITPDSPTNNNMLARRSNIDTIEIPNYSELAQLQDREGDIEKKISLFDRERRVRKNRRPVIKVRDNWNYT